MYPFLYFASRPGDWFEGANMGHLYELRFATAPSADQRRAIGEAWGRETAIGNVDPGPWRWADSWALVKVGERRIGEPDAFFRKMERVLRALHDVHPLAEVVFWGARDVTDNEWEDWTRDLQLTPTPGPAWPGYAPQSWYGQKRDPSLPTGGADPGFTAAVEAGREAGPPEEPEAPEPVITADPATPADLEDAVGRAEKFLQEYTMHRDYFDDGECKIWMQYTSPNLGKTAITVLFCCASDAEDPELVALCERAIGALHGTLPNLGYGVEWSLDAG